MVRLSALPAAVSGHTHQPQDAGDPKHVGWAGVDGQRAQYVRLGG